MAEILEGKNRTDHVLQKPDNLTCYLHSLVGGPVAVNDTLTGSYTFESTTVGIGGCGVVTGSCFYNGAITGLNFTVGSYTNTGVTGISSINISNNDVVVDVYLVVTDFTGPSINGLAPNRFDLILADFSQIMLSDTFLSATPPPLQSVLPNFSAFGITYLTGNVGAGNISGTITSLTAVPEPPTAWLFGLGFGLFALWKVSERRMSQTV